MSALAQVRMFRVLRQIVATGHTHLRDVGAQGYEGFVVWAGIIQGEVFEVRDALIPDQSGLRSPDGVCVTVDGAALHRLNVHLYEHGLTLGAQVHSHPATAYHSITDDTYAIATTLGSLSIVVPNFAADPFTLNDCAVYRLLSTGWTAIEPNDARQLIVFEG